MHLGTQQSQFISAVSSFSYLIKVKQQDNISSLYSILKCIVYVADGILQMH